MQGNCTQPPPQDLLPADYDDTAGDFPMLPLRKNQCLLLIDGPLLAAEERLWLDGLYIRMKRQERSQDEVVFTQTWDVPFERRGLWMTDVTIQGDSGPLVVLNLGARGGFRHLAWGVQTESNLYAQGACCARCAKKRHAFFACFKSPTPRADFSPCFQQPANAQRDRFEHFCTSRRCDWVASRDIELCRANLWTNGHATQNVWSQGLLPADQQL